MVNSPIQIIKLIRPIHWVKNFALFAALVFSEQLFISSSVIKVVWAFLAFNFAASATYVINDIFDIKEDRLHPIKRKRPIASGSIPISFAWSLAAILGLGSLALALNLSAPFFTLVLGYIILQIGYSTFLKKLAIIDILTIATGFIIRVYAGAFVIDAHLSVWFLLCVVSVALFLASGKRRAELGIVETPGKTRKSLVQYPKELLNSYVTMFGNAAWMSWALFTFFEGVKVPRKVWIFLAEISRTTTVSKLLMITIPVTIFGVMRYQSLIFRGRSESPEKLLLTDRSLIASVIIWTALVIILLYSEELMSFFV